MAKKEKYKIGLLGLGTVGYGVYQVVEYMQKEQWKEKLGVELEIPKVMVKEIAAVNKKIQPHTTLYETYDEILNDDEIDIIVELMGGIEPAHTYVKMALERGKSVVSANKDVYALYAEELEAVAKENNCDLLYEAAVAGAIPIMRPLRQCMLANNLQCVMGILNGTTNYILTKMEEERWSFEQALAEAQALGYAERNPTADVDGIDAARKVALLAANAFHSPVTLHDVYTEGIRHITPEDIAISGELGYRIKLLGITELVNDTIKASVYPALIKKEHQLSNVSDSFNAVYVYGDAIDEAMFYGRGAGELPTASAVCGDIADIIRNMEYDCVTRVRGNYYNHYTICPIDSYENAYFLRIKAADITVWQAIFDQFGIKIAVTKEYRDSVAVITEKATEKVMAELFEALNQAENIQLESKIRVFA